MATPLMTAEDLLHVDIPSKRVELVRGVLVVSEPPGYFHGAITARLAKVLSNYADPNDLGRVLAGDAGFKLAADPDTVRGPDVAFIRRDRQPHPAPRGFAAFPPDLIVEVLSPNDRPGQTLGKVGDWLSAGTKLVWVIDPDRRIARIYRADGTETTIGERDQLDGEDILPGFTCLLSEVLAD
jgi:Uma2 family endonuclease